MPKRSNEKMNTKNISSIAFRAFILIASMLPSCTHQDEFHSVALGEIQFDFKPIEIEFLMPVMDYALIAISGELLEDNANIHSFASSSQFAIEFIYKDGRISSTGWLFPTIANWHNPRTSFVISKEINEEPGNRIEKIKLSIKRKDFKVPYKSQIKLYSDYFK
jgi:hypothetical protein